MGPYGVEFELGGDGASSSLSAVSRVALRRDQSGASTLDMQVTAGIVTHD